MLSQEVKITLAGETSVGKSVLFSKLVGFFRDNNVKDTVIHSQPTIGAAYMSSGTLIKTGGKELVVKICRL